MNKMKLHDLAKIYFYRELLQKAPDGATHVDTNKSCYIMVKGDVSTDYSSYLFKDGSWEAFTGNPFMLRLYDLGFIVDMYDSMNEMICEQADIIESYKELCSGHPLSKKIVINNPNYNNFEFQEKPPKPQGLVKNKGIFKL